MRAAIAVAGVGLGLALALVGAAGALVGWRALERQHERELARALRSLA